MFFDFDGDNQRDGGEPGAKALTVQLDRLGDGTVDATTKTGEDGLYSFGDVPDGNHKITLVAPSQFTVISTNPLAVTVTGNKDVANQNFAIKATGAIDGLVFEDASANYVLTTGEPGLAGLTVELDLFDDATVDITATNGRGREVRVRRRPGQECTRLASPRRPGTLPPPKSRGR